MRCTCFVPAKHAGEWAHIERMMLLAASWLRSIVQLTQSLLPLRHCFGRLNRDIKVWPLIIYWPFPLASLSYLFQVMRQTKIEKQIWSGREAHP